MNHIGGGLCSSVTATVFCVLCLFSVRLTWFVLPLLQGAVNDTGSDIQSGPWSFKNLPTAKECQMVAFVLCVFVALPYFRERGDNFGLTTKLSLQLFYLLKTGLFLLKKLVCCWSFPETPARKLIFVHFVEESLYIFFRTFIFLFSYPKFKFNLLPPSSPGLSEI